jgi:hypothetical protein
LSDAGNFGANQAYSGVVAIIYSMTKKISRLFFLLFGRILGLYGMMISGTRGAISVPFAGFMTFFYIKEKHKDIRCWFYLLH